MTFSFKCLLKLCAVSLFTIIGLFGLSTCSSSTKPTLYIFTWSDLFKPELIKQFENEFNCTVAIDTFDSNESMYAKLKLSSVNYDLIMPSNYYVSILQNQNMIQQINPRKIPNARNYDSRYFKFTPDVAALPYIVTFSGIAYRTDRVKIEDPSWGVFSRNDLKGRMTMLNDCREALGAALKYRGHSINSRQKEVVESAGELLLSWKKNLAKFESEQYKNGLSNGEFLLVQGYSIDITQVVAETPEVSFVYPKEGAIMSIDCMAIPTNAKNVQLAHDFINFMIEPLAALENMKFTNSLIPIRIAYEMLDNTSRDNPLLFPPEEDFERMELIEDLQGDIQIYYKVWDRVKSG
ncbi:MAG: spermidine/putrescine ABC transporter substrate-binding protein [Parachlamydiaceae bacterium]|nr:spermidine/putrescine ABC transporter substrate-binding protein [Parachlamydiaceae bacterium]